MIARLLSLLNPNYRIVKVSNPISEHQIFGLSADTRAHGHAPVV